MGRLCVVVGTGQTPVPARRVLFGFPITIATLYIYVTNEQATAEKNVVEDKCRRLQGEAKVRTYIPKIAGKTDRYIDTATTTDDDDDD